MHCPLKEVTVHMPALKNAIASTNIAYKQYARTQATELKGREDVWKDERKNVEDIAKLLHFD
jgi:hypothetical protein